jgi:GNAT superfamily N-acetyltransferase
MHEQIRMASPADYDKIEAVADEWWGRPIAGSLPRLFLDLFYRTSLLIDGSDGPDAFLIGILSPSDAERLHPLRRGTSRARKRGLGRALYEAFFRLARADGRTSVCVVTAPPNSGSIAFHRSMGFTVSGPVAGYNGPGRDLMVFKRAL